MLYYIIKFEIIHYCDFLAKASQKLLDSGHNFDGKSKEIFIFVYLKPKTSVVLFYCCSVFIWIYRHSFLSYIYPHFVTFPSPLHFSAIFNYDFDWRTVERAHSISFYVLSDKDTQPYTVTMIIHTKSFIKGEITRKDKITQLSSQGNIVVSPDHNNSVTSNQHFQTIFTILVELLHLINQKIIRYLVHGWQS